MTEGVEIVIKPKHIERAVYGLVIIVLVVLLIIKWGGSGGAVDIDTTGAVVAEAETSETDQTNTTSTEDLCENSVKDQDETDIDCGGNICDSCPEFKLCNIDSDCEDGWCRGNVKCVTPTCDDGVKNQDESNVDCGGLCGGFFYDTACHDEIQTRYSGRVDLIIVEVLTSITEFGDDYAKIESIKIKVDNGKDEDMILTVHSYAFSERGRNIFGIDPYSDEERPLTGSVNLPLLAQGESHTETIIVGRTLIETEPTEEYQIVIELRDDDDKLVKKQTWTNP